MSGGRHLAGGDVHGIASTVPHVARRQPCGAISSSLDSSSLTARTAVRPKVGLATSARNVSRSVISPTPRQAVDRPAQDRFQIAMIEIAGLQLRKRKALAEYRGDFVAELRLDRQDRSGRTRQPVETLADVAASQFIQHGRGDARFVPNKGRQRANALAAAALGLEIDPVEPIEDFTAGAERLFSGGLRRGPVVRKLQTSRANAICAVRKYLMASCGIEQRAGGKVSQRATIGAAERSANPASSITRIPQKQPSSGATLAAISRTALRSAGASSS